MNRDKKILIVDDDSQNIFALSATLRAKSLNFLTATDATKALDVLRKHTDVGIVLLDMMIPDIDGYEAIALLRKVGAYQSLPVIAVTAQAMAGDREKCLAAGANDYVSKPINVDLLIDVLEIYLK
jgi:CheY-like chemotaxis protein